jgi:hypothetical protein
VTRRALAAGLGLCLLGSSGSASAYCRTKACDTRPSYEDVWQEMPDEPCVRDSFGCPLKGVPLFWPARCISYTVQKDGSTSDAIPFETATAVIDQAFDAWQKAGCPGGFPSLVVADLGPVSCSRAEYNQDQPNANIFTFRDTSWPYDNAEDTLALTTITYNTETAEIYDADVEINSFDAAFTVTDDPALIAADLLSVLTHEVGHFLGLSHASLPGTTMFWNYDRGNIDQRTLDADDMAGICEIYPPGRTVNETKCDPRHGFSGACASPKDEGGCGISAGSRDLTALGLLAPLVVAWRARRRRRSPGG